MLRSLFPPKSEFNTVVSQHPTKIMQYKQMELSTSYMLRRTITVRTKAESAFRLSLLTLSCLVVLASMGPFTLSNARGRPCVVTFASQDSHILAANALRQNA